MAIYIFFAIGILSMILLIGFDDTSIRHNRAWMVTKVILCFITFLSFLVDILILFL